MTRGRAVLPGFFFYVRLRSKFEEDGKRKNYVPAMKVSVRVFRLPRK